MINVKKGDKVHYAPGYGDPENGIVKALCEDPDYVRVVYHCAGRWKEYENYTSARTAVVDLKMGWSNQARTKLGGSLPP